MLKNVLKLDGVRLLTKSEQKGVVGGNHCNPAEDCCNVCQKGVSHYYVYTWEACAPGYIRFSGCV